MAGDFSKPTVTSTKANLPGECNGNDIAAIKMDFENDGSANVPDGAIAFDYAGGRWKRKESGLWVVKQIKAGGIEDSAVTTAKIANDAVTETKLDPDAATRSTKLAQLFYYNPANGVVSQPMYYDLYIKTEPVTGDILSLIVPKACKVTHLSLDAASGQSPGSGESYQALLTKNGSSTSQSITITGLTNIRNYGAITAQSFAAGDTIDALFTATAGTPAALVMLTAWGHFTE